ncbi:hypothetical protein Bdiaspc4_26275 [Bradyrhizobium diazoefficiens]|nr:hypothetical protein AAV28_22375 [Bradyrhizobium diazoefficiens USDA 110]QBP23785.1 hypothetical protein Bdiaspc4_26275 [Bradyrhizobium diazoefficiens]
MMSSWQPVGWRSIYDSCFMRCVAGGWARDFGSGVVFSPAQIFAAERENVERRADFQPNSAEAIARRL